MKITLNLYINVFFVSISKTDKLNVYNVYIVYKSKIVLVLRHILYLNELFNSEFHYYFIQYLY